MHSGPMNLIFDADDTLWQNNVYFIEATEAFLDAMEKWRPDRDAVRAYLSDVERQAVKIHGYGTSAFTRCLIETATTLAPDIEEQTIADIEALGHAITNRDALELMPGVEEALTHLAGTHRLFLLTKGEDREQRAKLEQSRLATFFEDVAVVPEKDVAAYRALIKRLDLDPKISWMIGNSPKSDINPALAAGLNAVLIPHPQTWELEIEDVTDESSGRLHTVESMVDLIDLFTHPQ